MKRKEACKKYENCILTLVVMLLNVILMGICFDFYYDLNDDMMMKDIMSGVYTGTPDGRNMQTLYLLGAFIGLCYRLCGRIPWYGLFLCLCQFGCFYLLGVRLTGLMNRRRTGRAAVLAILSLLQWGVCLLHLVNVQYTITCAMLSATAIFLFVTTPETDGVKQFIVKNIPSMLLVILAYQLRTEMLLLTLPFAGLAGMFRWAQEKPVFTKENGKKYGGVVGLMLAGMVLSGLLDMAAYGDAQWQDFLDFFDARTTVYEFYPEVITQENYAGDLEKLGVTPVQQALLRNYNFGLDDAIDTQLLKQVADYAVYTVGASRDWQAVFREKGKLYVYRLFHGEDAPYNVMVIWAYGAVLAAGLVQAVKEEKEQRRRGLADLGLLVLTAAVRTAAWLFLLMRGRTPERITHSLYLVEFALLSAVFVHRIHSCGVPKGIRYGMDALLLLLAAVGLITGIGTVESDQRQREEVNRDWQDVDAYCRAHDTSFYFEDVYSTVAFSQKMFAGVDNSLANYDILGGWMNKSPLYQEKLAQYDMESAAEALLYQDNVYLIMSDAEAAAQGFGWLIDYYADQGIAVSVTRRDSINENFAVYEVED